MNKLLLVLAFALAGCGQYYETNAEEYQGDSSFEEVSLSTEFDIGQNITIDQGRLVGSLGRIEDLDDDASILGGWSRSDGANVDVVVERQDSAGMVRLIFENRGLDDFELVPGFHKVFRRNFNSGLGLHVNSLGCTGPQHPSWDYDAQADQVEMRIEEGPDNSRVMFFNVLWEDEEDAVAGQILLK